MSAVQSVHSLPVSPTFPKASAWPTTSLNPPHQTKEYADLSGTNTRKACLISDDRQLIKPSIPKALASAIAGKVFEVLKKFEQQISLRDCSILDQIKERVDGTLSNDFFMHFIELDTDLGICYSRLTKALEQFDRYLASVQSASGEVDQGPEISNNGKEILLEFVEIDVKIGHLGLELQSKMRGTTNEVLASIQECKGVLDSELKTGWKTQEAMDVQQALLETVGRPAIPEASGSAKRAANILGNTAMLGMCLDHKQQSEVLARRQEMYEQEKQKVIELEQRITESQTKIRELCSIWETAHDSSGLSEPADQIVETLETMRSVDIITFLNIKAGLFQAKGYIEALKTPVRDLVIQLAPYYRAGTHVVREVETFTRYAPDMVGGLKLLLSAKNIVYDTHEEIFERMVLDLGTATSHQVQEIQKIYGNKMIRIKPELQDIFRRETEAFETLFQSQIETIQVILEGYISDEKSQQAVIEREEDDRFHKPGYREGRPVVDSVEALDALRRVRRGILAIYRLSALSATAQDGNQTSHDWTLPNGLPNETLNRCDTSRAAMSTVLSAVASELDELAVSKGRKVPGKKPKAQVPLASLFTSFKRGFSILKKAV